MCTLRVSATEAVGCTRMGSWNPVLLSSSASSSLHSARTLRQQRHMHDDRACMARGCRVAHPGATEADSRANLPCVRARDRRS